ncbi:MAG: flagellar protein FlaG [Bacillota bacterium]
MRIQASGEVVVRTPTERGVTGAEQGGARSAQPLTNQRPAVTPRDVEKVIGKMNDLAHIFSKALKFEVADDGHRIIVKVVDTRSGEIIREIPPEKLVEAFESMEDYLGVLFDRKV